jgi:lipopolysaccharide transport system permease protein
METLKETGGMSTKMTISSPISSSPIERTVNAPVHLLQPSKGLFNLNLREIWQYRELLYFLVWRDVTVRYKQTVLGAAWAILQPLLTMTIFTVVFGSLAKVPSDGLPYPIFVYAGLLPWLYFAQAVSRSSIGLVGDSNLISKVYFPRMIIPLALVVAPALDFFFSFLVLLAMMVWYGLSPTAGVLALPVFFGMAIMTALAVGLWLAPLNVKYRDVGHTIPFFMQIWMFASPVIYPVTLVPESWRLLYSLNPMTGVIEGFRWALVGNLAPDFGLMGASTVAVLIVLMGGIVYFKNAERTLVDVV